MKSGHRKRMAWRKATYQHGGDIKMAK